MAGDAAGIDQAHVGAWRQLEAQCGVGAAFTLDVYSHLLPHMQDSAAAKVGKLLMGRQQKK